MDYLKIWWVEVMKSNLEALNNKKGKEKIELKKVQEIALLSQALIIVAIIISFIMSRYIPELNLLMNIYLIILSFVMAYTNYSIYKKKSMCILYVVFGIIIISSILLGMF